ncbi:hypothetical protein O181_071952 [Austropuccinia psidii MF-1]|uniref:Uncharacterized protein n=1 Tax=Austropuccinia psidii MF-1 TaxID=1389203 RepID=A0A9Q3F659_9BASI|nr:hypothetical protein [Austropuccinia psidii MF-1]
MINNAKLLLQNQSVNTFKAKCQEKTKSTPSHMPSSVSAQSFSFQESIPLESLSPVRLNFLNRLLPYLGAQELTNQGRGVLSQPRVMTLLHGCCGNPAWNQVGANWPHHILYG